MQHEIPYRPAYPLLKIILARSESIFLTTFHADQDGETSIAPSVPDDTEIVELQNQTMNAGSGACMCSSPGLDIDTAWGGAKTFFSREGLFLLKKSGSGTLFLSSYGALHEIDRANGETYRVDTGHMVALSREVTYRVTRVGCLKSTLFSGEGLVCELTGPA